MNTSFKSKQEFFEWYRNIYLRSDWWRTFRKKQLSKRPICEECLRAPATELHHRYYYDEWGSVLGRENSLTVTSICHDCHMEIEENKHRLKAQEKVDKVVWKVLGFISK